MEDMDQRGQTTAEGTGQQAGEGTTQPAWVTAQAPPVPVRTGRWGRQQPAPCALPLGTKAAFTLISCSCSKPVHLSYSLRPHVNDCKHPTRIHHQRPRQEPSWAGLSPLLARGERRWPVTRSRKQPRRAHERSKAHILRTQARKPSSTSVIKRARLPGRGGS